MPRIHNEIAIDRSAAEVWGVVGDLADVGWVPGIAAARLEGTRRICTTAGGPVIEEEILEHSDERRSYTYTQLVHPLGLRRSQGTLAVTEESGGSRVVWDAEIEFDDPAQEAQLLPLLEQGYAAALASLGRAVEHRTG